jgi:hypothetical protein
MDASIGRWLSTRKIRLLCRAADYAELVECAIRQALTDRLADRSERVDENEPRHPMRAMEPWPFPRDSR